MSESALGISCVRVGVKGSTRETDNDTFVPGKDSQFIQAGDEIPASGDVPSYKDAKREDGEWVHELPRS